MFFFFAYWLSENCSLLLKPKSTCPVIVLRLQVSTPFHSLEKWNYTNPILKSVMVRLLLTLLSRCRQTVTSLQIVLTAHPAAGACGAPTDKNHVIEIDKTAGCTNSDETLLTVTLNYNEDPTGDPLNIYIVDKSNGDSTIGNKSKKDIRE